MSNAVSWMLQLEIQVERGDDLRALVDEMVSATANEAGTLSYEWSISVDGKRCDLYERYVDSEATLAHLAIFGDRFAARFLDILKPTSFVVYGAPSPAVKDGLAGFNPLYMAPLGGFAR